MQQVFKFLKKISRKQALLMMLLLVMILFGILVWFNQRSFGAGADTSTSGSWKSNQEALGNGLISRPEAIINVTVRSAQDKKDSKAAVSIEKVQKEQSGYVHLANNADSGPKYTLKLMAGESVIDSASFSLSNNLYDAPPLKGEAINEPGLRKEARSVINFKLQNTATSVVLTNQDGAILDSKDLQSIAVENNQPNFHSIKASDFKTSNQTSSLFNSALAASTDGQYVDIVVIGDDYTDMNAFHNDVNRIYNNLLTYEPYKSRVGQLRLHYIDNTADLGCYYDVAIPRLLYCSESLVFQRVNSSGVPFDTIAVVVNNATYGGAGGSIAVGYNGSWGPQAIVHELGHSFGLLEDEYNAYSSNGYISGRLYGPNCYAGSPPYNGWNGTVSQLDYALGCTYPNYYRSSSNSLMMSIDSYFFNAISQAQINKQITYFAGAYSDAVLPTSTLTSPVNGATVTGTVTITDANSDNAGIARTELWIDGMLYRTSYSSPYNFSWPTTTFNNGPHTLKTIAYDTAQNKGESAAISVTVANASTDVTAPTVSITSPAAGTTLSGVANILISATDNVGITKVTLADNGFLVDTDLISPYSFSWDTTKVADGAHVLTATAYDAAGNSTVSQAINVVVDNVIHLDVFAPSISITYPVNGATLARRTNVTITANASDNIGVTKVMFYANGGLVCTDTTAPYSCAWKAAGTGKAKKATIKTDAYDAAGNIGTSSVVITVK